MSTRIRWTAVDGTVVSWFGYVGTAKTALFQILHPVSSETSTRFDEWALCATFTGAQDKPRYGGNDPGAPDRLKAEAERWLEEYVASLGAVFPEPGDTVTISLSEQDTRAVLANALDEYADWCRACADEDTGDCEWRTRWAEIADRMYGQVTEPGESAVTAGEE